MKANKAWNRVQLRCQCSGAASFYFILLSFIFYGLGIGSSVTFLSAIHFQLAAQFDGGGGMRVSGFRFTGN